MDNTTKMGTYLKEGKIDTGEQTKESIEVKFCPILTLTSIRQDCIRKLCAWYDDQNNRCAIITFIRR